MKKEEKNRKENGSSLEPKSILFNSKPNSIKQSSYFLSHRTNFMLDSGATSHFVSDRKLPTNFKEEKEFIQMADNSKTNCDRYGMLFWKTLDIYGKEITIKLKKYIWYLICTRIFYPYQLYLNNPLTPLKSDEMTTI